MVTIIESQFFSNYTRLNSKHDHKSEETKNCIDGEFLDNHREKTKPQKTKQIKNKLKLVHIPIHTILEERGYIKTVLRAVYQ